MDTETCNRDIGNDIGPSCVPAPLIGAEVNPETGDGVMKEAHRQSAVATVLAAFFFVALVFVILIARMRVFYRSCVVGFRVETPESI